MLFKIKFVLRTGLKPFNNIRQIVIRLKLKFI